MKTGTPGEPHPIDYYRLKVQALQAGDVILTASPKQAVSKLIRAVTGSDYSHAILVLDPPYAIESSDHGVVKFRLDRFAVRAPENIVVRRVINSTLRNSLDFRAMIRLAESRKTREYAERDVLTALFERVPRFEPGKFFCSQFVAQVYSDCGLPLVLDKKPEKVTPGMLAVSEDCHVLADVPNVLEFTRAGEIPFTPAFLDGPNQPSPAERETVARQHAVRKVAPAFERVELTVHDFTQALTILLKCWQDDEAHTLELDRAFAEAIMDSGLLAVASQCYPGPLKIRNS